MTNYDDLSDTEILELAGPYGPGIIGKELFDRAAAIRNRGDDGKLGPAITDPNFAAKQAAKRAASTPPPDPADAPATTAPVGTWAGITLSGAKKLAQENGVSYKPGVKLEALLKLLTTAGIAPPPATE